MNDILIYRRSGRTRIHYRLRFNLGWPAGLYRWTIWWSKLSWWLLSLWRNPWPRCRGVDMPWTMGTKTTRGNGICYCPLGSVTEFWFGFLACGLHVWIDRDPTPRPCSCDKIIWLSFPENHQEEIEEYGLERLNAEYPGVWKE